MPFEKGKSGNPAGRKPSQTAARMRELITADDVAEILASVMQAARDGDTQAAKIILDRVFPALKTQALPVEIETGQTLAQTGDNVISATMSGDIAPDIGSQLITALAAQSRVLEMTELAARLERIETELSKRSS